MKVSIYSAFIWLAICIPNESSSQSVVVVATPDMSQVHGFCDIVTITVLVRNLTGSSASFSGEIEFRNDFIEIVEYSELTNYNRTDVGAEASITYTIGTLSQGAYAYRHYQVKVKSYTTNTYWTRNIATVTSNPSFTSYDDCFIGAKEYFPIYGQASVNEIMEETANQNILLSLFPVEPLPGAPNTYACNDELSQAIYIDDELIFDVPEYCIYNGDNNGAIIIGEGGSIKVETGSTLRLDGISLRSCNEMWKGIYVEHGGTLIMQRCTIAYAQYAIQAERGAKLICDENIFLDNNVGLYVSPFAYPPDPEHPENSYVNMNNFTNNVFYGSGEMLPAYDGQTPVPAEKPFAGIYINNLSSFVLPGKIAAGHYNSFENLTNGIIAYNSSISIGDAFFIEITPNPGDGSFIDGYGIYIKDGKQSKIRGDGVGESADFTHHFTDCTHGIYNSIGGIEVTGITMGKVGTGISIRDVKNRSILLKDNIIEAEKTGILLNQCVPRVGDIINNSIKIDGDGDLSVGIELNNPPVPLFWNIEDNPITLHEAISGIYNSVGKDIKILNNTITLGEGEEDDRNGISLDGTEHSIVKCNVINGDIELEGPNYHLARGIDMYLTTNFDVACNIVQDLRDGIFISTQNSKCELRANTINNNFVGLHLGSDAIIGSQDLAGNLWEEDSYDWAARHEGTALLVGLSPFTYNELVNTDSKPYPIFAASTWFKQVGAGLYSCEGSSVCPGGYGSGSDFTSWDSIDYKLVAGNLGFSHFNNCLSWMGRFQTYKRLHTATSTSGWPSSITTFLSNQASLNIGKFSNAFDSLNHSLYYVGGYEQVLDDFRDSINSIFTRIHYLDSLLLEDRFNSTISDLITEEYEAIFLYECEFRETDSLINMLLQDRLDNAISYTESISPDSIWQEALKFSLLEFLNYAKDTNLLSPEDLADLASSCPDKYGDPVFYARSLLNTDSEKIAYNDYALCSFSTPRTSELGTTTFKRIYPNPASSMIELEVSGEISNISIYTIDGKFASLNFSIAENKANANTFSLASGIYLAKVMYLDGRIETLKFIVTH